MSDDKKVPSTPPPPAQVVKPPSTPPETHAMITNGATTPCMARDSAPKKGK